MLRKRCCLPYRCVIEMKTLIIVGAGEFGMLVKEIAELLGYEKIDFLDDNAAFPIATINSV